MKTVKTILAITSGFALGNGLIIISSILFVILLLSYIIPELK